jgi:hypothetical protein
MCPNALVNTSPSHRTYPVSPKQESNPPPVTTLSGADRAGNLERVGRRLVAATHRAHSLSRSLTAALWSSLCEDGVPLPVPVSPSP